MKLCLIIGGWYKDIRVPNLPICKSFEGYDEVHIMGIEPLNKWETVFNIINKIKEISNIPIHIYTCKTDDIGLLLGVLDAITHLHVTVRTYFEFNSFDKFEAARLKTGIFKKELYLDVYKTVSCNTACFPCWKITKDVLYEHKHTPMEDEVMLRWENS